MVNGESGNRIYLDAEANVSTASNFLLYLKFESTVKEITTGIHVGTVNKTSDCGEVFLANQYFYYDTQPGDIDNHGQWKAWTEYDKPGGIHRVGKTAYFEVEKRG